MGASIKSPSRGASDGREAAKLGALLREKRLTLAAAESCTGGLLSSLITDVAGSSDYFTGAVVAYDNEVKKKILGVRAGTIKNRGAVSAQTAAEMAEGVRKRLNSGIGVSITGIAGPGGGNPEKPVGTVFIAVTDGKRAFTKKFLFKGTRRHIKEKSARGALSMLIGLIKAEGLAR